MEKIIFRRLWILAEPIKEIAAECGIEFSDEGTYVIDRFNSDVKDDGRNTLIISDADNLINNKLIVGEARTGAGLLYRGVGLVYYTYIFMGFFKNSLTPICLLKYDGRFWKSSPIGHSYRFGNLLRLQAWWTNFGRKFISLFYAHIKIYRIEKIIIITIIK